MSQLTLYSKTIICSGLVLSVSMLGYLDYVTLIEFDFFVFYFLPISITAFIFGLVPSVSISVLCAGVWAAADILNNHLYSHPAYEIWNTLIRLVSFLSIGWAVSKITALLEKERSLSKQMRMALAEVKVLKGLLPICASCKKIREDNGSWQALEQYMEKHSAAQFTHGLCPDCARAVLEEAGITHKTG